MRIMRTRLWVTIAGIAWMLLVTCIVTCGLSGAGRAAQGGAHDELRIGMTQYPSTLHPGIDSMLAKTYVLGMVRRPFTVYNADWELECMLCEALPDLAEKTAIVETRPDGSRGIAATYTIREDAKWGDGKPVTTRDVMFGWQVGKHPKTGFSNFKLYAEDIFDITVHDERTFTLHMDKVSCDYRSINDFKVLPAHLELDIFEKDPDNYRHNTLYDTDPTNPGLYYGPYRIVHVEQGSRIVLAPNPTWWGEKPAFKKVIIKVIENTAALGGNLLSGEIDYIAGELGMTTDQALSFEKRLKSTRPGQFDVTYHPSLLYEHIDVNLDNPILADIRVRRAILHAINRDAISQHLFGGKQPVAHTSISPLDNVHSDDHAVYAYDPQKASQLLEEAGWKMSADGVRVNAQGERLVLSLMTTAGDRTRALVQQAIQSDLSKVGIRIKIENEPARVLFGQTVRERQFPHMVMYAWSSAPGNIPRTSLHSSMIPSADNGWAGQNYPGLRSPEFDKVLDDLEVTCDAEQNRALWARLQQLYADQLPALPLYFRANAYIIPKWLSGITPTGHQDLSTLWIEHWKAKEP